MGPPITTPQVVNYPGPSYGSSYGQPIVPPPPGFTPQGYHNPMVSQQGLTTYYPGMNTQAMGGQLPSVQDSLRSLQSAGLLPQDPALAEVDTPTPDYEVGLKFGDLTLLDNAIPLSNLQDDIRHCFLDIISSHSGVRAIFAGGTSDSDSQAVKTCKPAASPHHSAMVGEAFPHS